MSEDFAVTDIDRRARQALRGWLDDAAGLGIDPDVPETIQRAYDDYLVKVLATPPDRREDPTPVLTSIGMAMGEHLVRHTALQWRVVTDEAGSDLGVATADGSGAFFPVDPVAANWSQQTQGWIVPFLAGMVEQLGEQSGSDQE